MIPLTQGAENHENHRGRKQNGGCQGPGVRKCGVSVSWRQSFSSGRRKIWDMDDVKSCTTMFKYLVPLNCTVKNG